MGIPWKKIGRVTWHLLVRIVHTVAPDKSCAEPRDETPAPPPPPDR